MLLKGLVVTTLLASTPFALFATQDPQPAPSAGTNVQSVEAAARAAAAAAQQQAQKASRDLANARAELDAARKDLAALRNQLEAALDALDRSFEPQRDRNCSPVRSRALMSHYQWLREQGHERRAATVVAKVVDEVGDDAHRLGSVARHLMTDEETAGKFDDVALAFAERLEGRGEELDARQLDTVAMAHFLAGHVDRAVALQAQAMERGGRGEEMRQRLRTYRAAQAAIAKASTAASTTGAMVASTND